MRQQLGALVVLLVTVIGCNPPAPSQPASPQKKSLATIPKGAEIVLFCGLPEVEVRPLIELFEQRTGVRANVKFAASAQLAGEIAAKKKDDQIADVFWSSDVTLVESLRGKETSPRFRRLRREAATRTVTGLRAMDERWVGISARAIIPIENATEEKSLPSTFTALLTAKKPWRIAIAQDDTLPSFVGWLARHDKEGVLKWIGTAKSNFQRSEQRALARLVLNQADVALIGSGTWSRLQRNSGPVADDGTIMVQNTKLRRVKGFGSPGYISLSGVAVLEDAKQPEVAEKFVEFLLSDVAQQYLASQHLSPTVDKIIVPKGIYSAKEVARIVKSQTSSWPDAALRDEIIKAMAPEL